MRRVVASVVHTAARWSLAAFLPCLSRQISRQLQVVQPVWMPRQRKEHSRHQTPCLMLNFCGSSQHPSRIRWDLPRWKTRWIGMPECWLTISLQAQSRLTDLRATCLMPDNCWESIYASWLNDKPSLDGFGHSWLLTTIIVATAARRLLTRVSWRWNHMSWSYRWLLKIFGSRWL